MKYGFIELKRTTRSSDTSWWWLVQDPDDVDREEPEDGDYGPTNTLFWYYPEFYTKEQAIQKMLEKRKQEMHDNILWAKHSYEVIKEAADRYLKNGNTPEDFDRTEVLPTDKERLEKAEQEFEEWYENNGNKLYDKDMKKAWISCFKKENFIKDENV
jgi:hypothetical protein